MEHREHTAVHDDWSDASLKEAEASLKSVLEKLVGDEKMKRETPAVRSERQAHDSSELYGHKGSLRWPESDGINNRSYIVLSIIGWLIIGGLIGWIASMIMRTNAEQGVLLNIVVGIVGAALAGFVVTGGSINQDVNITSILVSLLGAVVLLGIVNLVRRGAVR